MELRIGQLYLVKVNHAYGYVEQRLLVYRGVRKGRHVFGGKEWREFTVTPSKLEKRVTDPAHPATQTSHSVP
jgi:hypothetical protein